MVRTTVGLAALLLLMTNPANAATKGEYGNHCAMGFAAEMDVETDCSVNAEIEGKTYCFGDESAKAEFLKDPEGNIAKADAFAAKKD